MNSNSIDLGTTDFLTQAKRIIQGTASWKTRGQRIHDSLIMAEQLKLPKAIKELKILRDNLKWSRITSAKY